MALDHLNLPSYEQQSRFKIADDLSLLGKRTGEEADDDEGDFEGYAADDEDGEGIEHPLHLPPRAVRMERGVSDLEGTSKAV